MAQAKRVAVVGSGCAGIGAVWALRSTSHDVHLYEAQSRLGGHTNTVEFGQGGKAINVDTGFIVMNTATYPNFIAFLKELRIPTVKTEMTFGVSRDRGFFEWSGTSLSSVFAQRSNLFSLRFWRMIFDIIRFNQFALDLLAADDGAWRDQNGASKTQGWSARVDVQESIGDYLEREGYSEGFINDYLIPVTACVWSTSPNKCSLQFPAITLVRFLWNHHLLNTLSARAPWMTIPGGTNIYINKALEGLDRSHIHHRKAVQSLWRRADGKIRLVFQDGAIETFDHVILATHGDQAMEIMQEAATPEERAILSKFRTNKNVAVLHNDLSLMPTNRKTWSAWNYLTTSNNDWVSKVCLTYCMNILQHISYEKVGPVLVTLNPLHSPNPASVQGEWVYEHPLYTPEAIRAQALLPSIQHTRGMSYAGAWTKYGFHEDGFSSGLKVAVDHLGAKLPFEFVDSTYSRGRRPQLDMKNHVLRLLLRIVNLLIISIELLAFQSQSVYRRIRQASKI